MSDAFKGDWGKRFPNFSDAASEVLGRVAKTSVKILVWGPGEHSESYGKRQRIVEHLSNGIDEVMTSEQIMEAAPKLKEFHVHDAEYMHLQMCNVLFVLIVKDRAVTGNQTEVAIFRNTSEFRQKAYLLVPEFAGTEVPRAFLSQGWISYDDSRTFRYTDDQFQNCERIRSFCAEIVDQIRKSLYFSR